ncbi:MAG: glycosyltransferase family 4 protein [Acidimicrobiaceae bacterium]|nr:glycosyltransferase family 4 protein [Acidimicrobiaceae bacterium]
MSNEARLGSRESVAGNGAGRRLSIGIYSPFFGTTIGGGEKYLGVTAEAVRDGFPDADLEIMTPTRVDVNRYERMLGLDLQGIGIRSNNPGASRLKRRLARIPTLRLYRDLVVSAQAVPETARYDLLISMVYVLPAFSRARRGVILCQFPYERRLKPVESPRIPGRLFELYSRPYWALRRHLFAGEIDAFQLIICQSDYVRRWVANIWHRDSMVVNPPIDVPADDPTWERKENIILSVGRFFAGGHSKRHDVMVRAFREMYDAGHTDWELHLIGSVQTDKPADCEYFANVVSLTSGYPIRLHVDVPGQQVEDLYRRASIYWHAAGYGVDEERHPAELEHFGMTTAEAMGHGVAPVAIARGGQPEVVQDGVNGYLWRTTDELKARTVELMGDRELRRRLGDEARRSVARFSRHRFKENMIEALKPIIAELQGEAMDREQLPQS